MTARSHPRAASTRDAQTDVLFGRPGPGYVVGVHDELMRLTLRMIAEHPDIPAGSVMRCVARAARLGLVSGTATEDLPRHAERTARRALAERSDRGPSRAAWPGTASGTRAQSLVANR